MPSLVRVARTTAVPSLTGVTLPVIWSTTATSGFNEVNSTLAPFKLAVLPYWSTVLNANVALLSTANVVCALKSSASKFAVPSVHLEPKPANAPADATETVTRSDSATTLPSLSLTLTFLLYDETP